MQKKFKKIFFFLILFFTLLPLSHAFALETVFPTIPGFPNINTNPNLPNFVDYFFGLAIISAGAVAFFSLVAAGVKLLISAGNPSAVGEARERIVGSLTGVVLLLFSFIILQTINPGLVSVRTVTLTLDTPDGVYRVRRVLAPLIFNDFFNITIQTAYADPANSVNPGDQLESAPESDPNTSPENASGFDELWYYCGQDSTGQGPNLIVQTYDQINMEEDAQADTHFLACGDVLSLSGEASYEYHTEEPGIIFYSKVNCEGGSTGPNTITNETALPVWIQSEGVLSARIINGNGSSDPRFGFVLNLAPDLKGQCTNPYMNFVSADINDPANKGSCVELNSDPTCVPPSASAINTAKPFKVSLASFSNSIKPLINIRLADTTTCTTNAVCGSDMVCNNGQCVPPTSILCTTDAGCPTNFTCVNEQCVGQPTPCATDAECGSDMVCSNEQCIPAIDPYACLNDGICNTSAGESSINCPADCPVTTCTQNTNCASGETCVSGQCATSTDVIPNICPSYAYAYVIRGDNTISGDVGDGVTFYEDGGPDIDPATGRLKSYNRLIGKRYLDLSRVTIGQEFSMDGTNPDFPVTSPDQLLRDYGDIQTTGVDPNAQDTCGEPETEYPCTNNIDPRGNFLTLLYSENQTHNTNKACEFFTDLTDLHDERYIRSDGSRGILMNGQEIYQGYIFPIMP